MVFLVHAQYERTGGLSFAAPLANLGNDAVMVFFVLSGFVIAYVADKKEKTFHDYALSRLARLYSVAAPALALTVVVDYVGSRIDYSLYTGWDFLTDHPWWRWRTPRLGLLEEVALVDIGRNSTTTSSFR